MELARIQFKTVNDIHEFVKKAEKYQTDIDLQLGSKIVDAKSLMGVLYFGTNKDLQVRVPENVAESFLSEISFCIAD